MAVSDLNFARAEYGGAPEPAACAVCSRGLNGEYFDIEGSRVCRQCAERARTISPGHSTAAFWRSVITGALAAAFAGTIYFLLFRATHGSWMVFASIGVGYLIGHAMRLGSGGVGGRRYQVVAALLTYAAVMIGASAAIFADMMRLTVGRVATLMFTPVLLVSVGQYREALLMLFFCIWGMGWAWKQMAGAPWKITGPHPL
ncbi:MAG TPA: hypothetical protein VGN16_08160 [Acidobacteriaceae bacterium]|jgi:hypothetical protein